MVADVGAAHAKESFKNIWLEGVDSSKATQEFCCKYLLLLLAWAGGFHNNKFIYLIHSFLLIFVKGNWTWQQAQATIYMPNGLWKLILGTPIWAVHLSLYNLP